MTTEKNSIDNFTREKAWLLTVIKNTPYQDHHYLKSHKRGEEMELFGCFQKSEPHIVLAVDDVGYTMDVARKTQEIIIEKDLGNTCLVFTSHAPKTESDFLTKHDIQNNIIQIQGRYPKIAIDLEQENLLEKLQTLYTEECVPVLIKKGADTIINPDGEDVTPKDVAENKITTKFTKMINEARAEGIDGDHFVKLLKQAENEHYLTNPEDGKGRGGR